MKENQLKYSILFDKYPDVVKSRRYAKMLPKTGKKINIWGFIKKKRNNV